MLNPNPSVRKVAAASFLFTYYCNCQQGALGLQQKHQDQGNVNFKADIHCL